MFKLLKIAKKEDPRRPRSTRRRRRRIPGAAGGRSVIDHAASTQSVIFNKKSMNTYMYDLRKYISIYLPDDALDLTIYADCLQGAGILGSGPSQLYKLHLGLSQVSNNHLLVKRREEFAFLIDYSHFPDRPIGSNSEESISRPIQVYSTRVNKTRSNSTRHPQFVLPLYIFKCTVVIC